MIQEEKKLLLQDLSARLPYGVKLHNVTTKNDIELYAVDLNSLTASFWTFKGNSLRIGNISTIFRNDGSIRLKPYLRPMSSMSEEERIEFSKLLDVRYCEEDWEGHISTSYCIEIDNVYTDDKGTIKYPSSFSMDAIDWLNTHHFDYRGLIEKGLALEAPKGLYKT